ncbi:MAG: NUDIX hydrolase [Rhodoferax sp.]|nr:NUDIX hydrolase [Rhodoferax sp.]
MSDRHLVEVQKSHRELFRGQLLHAFSDTVALPDGNSAVREYVVHPGAVMVIALLQNDDGPCSIVMERQFRYPVGRVMIEFPAGKLDPGESRWECAQRELREETGFVADEWAHAGIIHPLIAYSTEVIDIWFARHLTLGPRQLDGGEFLDVFVASPVELLEWCYSGAVTDGKTLSGALWLHNVLCGTWQLDWKSTEVMRGAVSS